LILVLALLLLPVLVFAVEPGEILADPALENRARVISRDLRCLVCQNQSIDDSNAPLAADLRRLVRERLRSGDSDAQVVHFVTERYGDYVLLRPPVQPNTYFLWLAPPVLLGLGVGTVALFLRRKRGEGRGEGRSVDPVPLTPEEEKALASLLIKERM
jgi:cytochrome c-type biogenesis protein CcmH